MRLVLLTALLAAPVTAHAASFERFDAPGATTTCGTAIASNGLVVGTAYVGTIGVVTDAAQKKAPVLGAFLYRSGHFTQPKPAEPAGTLTFTGVNRFGAITGFDFDSASIATQNFVYAAHTTTSPTITGANTIYLAGITDHGTLVGQATVSGGGPFGTHNVGFLMTASGAVTLIDDGTGTAGATGVDRTGNYVVGSSLDGGGWLYHAGSFTPVAFPGAAFTYPSSISSKAAIAGNYVTIVGSTATGHGFRLRNGVYTSFDLPGADATTIGGMNEAGQITGCFTKGTLTHGYLYTP